MTQKIFISENVTSGALCDQILPPIVPEAFAILRTLIEEFYTAGYIPYTTLDWRLKPLSKILPQKTCIYYINDPNTFLERFRTIAQQTDMSLLVAPEIQDAMGVCNKILNEVSPNFLGSDEKTTAILIDKLFTSQFFLKQRLPAPKSISLENPSQAHDCFSYFNFPSQLVVKPRQGAGADGVRLITSERQLKVAMSELIPLHGPLVVQEYIPGIAASVSLIVEEDQLLFLSLNSQELSFDELTIEAEYKGGKTPFNHIAKDRVFELTEAFIKTMPGLRGFIGIDMILADEKATFIEVNLRPTTPIIALAKIGNVNLAELVLTAKNRDPYEFKTFNYAEFGKVELECSTITQNDLLELVHLPGVVAPPFKIKDVSKSIAIVRGIGSSAELAHSQFQKVKLDLQNQCSLKQN
ncbi:MAG: ATP-grasp domain-containing protein [Promethearchaeota archaeon]